LVGDEGEEHFRKMFQPDFFDLVIVDECHRGSAKEESRWRLILDYFKSATQIGMTATPKETRYVSNIHYFGDPNLTIKLIKEARSSNRRSRDFSSKIRRSHPVF
jgi:type I restriction enzyme R subunit